MGDFNQGAMQEFSDAKIFDKYKKGEAIRDCLKFNGKQRGFSECVDENSTQAKTWRRMIGWLKWKRKKP